MKLRILYFVIMLLVGSCAVPKARTPIIKKPIFPRRVPAGAVESPGAVAPKKVCPNPSCTCEDCPCVDCKCGQIEPPKQATLPAPTPTPHPVRATGHWENRYSGLFGRRVERVWVQDVPRQTTYGKVYSSCATGQCR